MGLFLSLCPVFPISGLFVVSIDICSWCLVSLCALLVLIMSFLENYFGKFFEAKVVEVFLQKVCCCFYEVPKILPIQNCFLHSWLGFVAFCDVNWGLKSVQL
jgi:hypothetical protein